MRLESAEPLSADDSLISTIDGWRTEQIGRDALIAALGNVNSPGVPVVAELLFEAANDAEIASEAIRALSRCSASQVATRGAESHSAARALAYAVSEPFLDEPIEAQACAALRNSWPAARTYILYNLRKHSHEDIPFRWMELLAVGGELRAVDRILEEVLIHAGNPDYREDLMAALDLINSSEDPGRAGKVLRLLEGPQVPPETATLLEEWAEASSNTTFLGNTRSEDLRPPDFVHLSEDFSGFATRMADIPIDEICEQWNEAYHESLGWLQRSQLPRGHLERTCEAEIEKAIIAQLSFGRRPDEGSVRGLVDSLRDDHLGAESNGQTHIVEIYRTRPRGDPWLLDIYMREINGLYLRAAGSYDAGDVRRAREELNVVLEIEPAYALAIMLDALIGGS